MPDWIRPYFSRILGPVIVYFVGWLANRFGVIVTDDQLRVFSELLVALIFAGIAHKAIDSKVNPHDTASITATKETKGAP